MCFLAQRRQVLTAKPRFYFFKVYTFHVFCNFIILFIISNGITPLSWKFEHSKKHCTGLRFSSMYGIVFLHSVFSLVRMMCTIQMRRKGRRSWSRPEMHCIDIHTLYLSMYVSIVIGISTGPAKRIIVSALPRLKYFCARVAKWWGIMCPMWNLRASYFHKLLHAYRRRLHIFYMFA